MYIDWLRVSVASTFRIWIFGNSNVGEVHVDVTRLIENPTQLTFQHDLRGLTLPSIVLSPPFYLVELVRAVELEQEFLLHVLGHGCWC